MKRHLGGTFLIVAALLAQPAGAHEDEASEVTIFKAKTVAAAYARYGKACPRFFGGPVPSHIGHHLGDGRLPTGAKLTQPSYIGAQGLRLGPTLRGDGSVAAAPTSIGWRLAAAGQGGTSLQFCRVGAWTLGRWMRAPSGQGGAAKTESQAYSPEPHSYQPVTYRPYGLEPSSR